VKELGRRLTLDGLAALAVVVAVVGGLWLVVLWISGERSGRRAHAKALSTNQTPDHSMTTLPIERLPKNP
jgi:hypothetical protein